MSIYLSSWRDFHQNENIDDLDENVIKMLDQLTEA